MNVYGNATSLEIAKGKIGELDRRNFLEYVTDKVPVVGLHLKLDRLKKRRRNIMGDLAKELGSEKFDRVNKLLTEHNETQLFDAEVYHSMFKWACGVGGLVGMGYTLGNYFAN